MNIPNTTSEASEFARTALRSLKGPSNRADATSTVAVRTAEDGEVVVSLPPAVLRLLVEVLGEMANGNAVSVVSTATELTTQQAADLLCVSRPFVVGLLESGQIPFHKVGTHRRVRMMDLLAYKARDDAERQRVADELTAEAQELGLGY